MAALTMSAPLMRTEKRTTYLRKRRPRGITRCLRGCVATATATRSERSRLPAASPEEGVDAAAPPPTALTLAFEDAGRLVSGEPRLVRSPKSLEISLAERQGEPNPLGRGQSQERCAILLAKPVSDTAHRKDISMRPRPALRA